MKIKTKNMNWPDIKSAIDKGYKTIVIAVGGNRATWSSPSNNH